MRDPARIDRILKLLEQRWKEAPDQRLGQLVLNFVSGTKHPRNSVEARLFVHLTEDDDLEASLARGWEQFER